MRILGMASALLTLIAVFFAVSSLTAFGYDSWGIVKILAPMALGMVLLIFVLFGVGKLSLHLINRLDREAEQEKAEEDGATADESP